MHFGLVVVALVATKVVEAERVGSCDFGTVRERAQECEGIMATKLLKRMEKVAASQLYVSEPSPFMFGNGPNEQDNLAWTNWNWLKSRFHFSFAEYQDADNINFGVLRVTNDDIVQPNRGFGTHPHRDMEICTYIVEGELTHQDSMGSKETLGRGSVQFMTAGTGVYHSEANESPDKPVRFIQMWIIPSARGLTPNYGGYKGDYEARHNKWQHLASNVQESAVQTPVKINQDANLFVSELDQGNCLDLAVNKGRQAYLLMMESQGAELDQTGGEKITLKSHDAARIYGPTEISISAPNEGGAHVLVLEMAEEK